MTTVNHECYVSLEVAKLLKEAGFDWEVNTCRYNSSPDKVSSNGTLTSNFNGYAFQHIAISAPTLDVAQRWLREVKRINVEVMYLFEPCNHYFARACYLDINKPLYIPNPPASTIYEEAQEAGIKKALEIVLEKGE